VNFPQVDFHIKRDRYVYMRILEGHTLPSGSDHGDDFTSNIDSKFSDYRDEPLLRVKLSKSVTCCVDTLKLVTTRS
jgi:hypothetical protein